MALFSQEWLCRKIIEGSRDAIIFADRAGVIRLWNTGAGEIFGYARDEALGLPLDLIIPENLRTRHHEGYARVMATGISKYSKDLLAVPGLTKNGQRISLEFSIALIQDEAGQILGTAAVIRDVTARWQREQEMKVRLKYLEERLGG